MMLFPDSTPMLHDSQERSVVPATLRPLAARLDAVLAAAAKDAQVPGAMAAVHAPRLGLRWRGAARGARSTPEDPVDAGTPFRIASVTKPFVAAALLRLVEDGRLALHGSLTALISSDSAALLARGGHDAGSITLSQLLAHTAGLPDHTSGDYGAMVQQQPDRRWTREQQLALAARLPAVTPEPGQRFAYSDTGYIVLGEVIERATGQAIGPAVRALLDYATLGLRHTHWEGQEPDPLPARARARQCIGDWDASALDPAFDLHGGGGLVSTVDDLCRFVRALLGGRVFRRPGTLAAALLVPPAERAAGAAVHSHALQTLPMGTDWGWGHLGFWGCGVVCSPDLDITVASTINQPAPADPDLRRRLLAELGGLVVAAQRARDGTP